MLLCAITDRRIFAGDEAARRRALLAAVRGWAAGGVDVIQLREKDLPPRELLALAAEVVQGVHAVGSETRLLLNGPAEIALEAGCDGVHLPGTIPSTAAAAARAIFDRAGRQAFLGRSCHAPEEIAASEADLILFAPVFEKSLAREGGGRLPGSGLEALAAAAKAAGLGSGLGSGPGSGLGSPGAQPVLALGGVTVENAPACLAAGAAGIAAIRLFAGEDWRRLRS